MSTLFVLMAPGFRGFFVGVLLVLGAGCTTNPSIPLVDVDLPEVPFYQPASVDALITTQPEVFVSNLNSRIRVISQRLEQRPSATLAERLAGDLLLRYRIIGNDADLDRAEAITTQFSSRYPERVGLTLLDARIKALVHQFADAESILQGVPAEQSASLRREIFLATGRFDQARQITQASPQDIVGLANRGNLALLEGQPEEAARLFNAAQFQYRGVSPLIVAWLHVQHGVLHLRHGQLEQAEAFFAAAHERLPQYFLATEHLAETRKLIGNFDSAAELYESVIEQTENPAFMEGLAEVESLRGNLAQAAHWQEQAAAGYARKLAERPAAWWGHAAPFLVRTNPPRALRMADQNAQHRGDVGSWILLGEIALEAGSLTEACRAIQAINRLGLNPPEVLSLRASTADSCQP